MKMTQKPRRKYHTFIRYFVPYFIMLLVLLLGFFYIIHNNVRKIYFQTQEEQIQYNISNIDSWLEAQLKQLDYINMAVESNTAIRKAKYDNSPGAVFQASQELKKYSTAAILISDIVYLEKETGRMISATQVMPPEGKIFTPSGESALIIDEIWNHAGNPPERLYRLEEGILLYLPKAQDDDTFLYIFNEYELQDALKSMLTVDNSAVSFYNGSEYLMGVQDGAIRDNIERLDNTSGKIELSGRQVFYSSSELDQSFRIIMMNDGHVLLDRLEATMKKIYLICSLLGVLGILVMTLGMKLTYVPIRNLAGKLSGETDLDSEGRLLNQIDQAFQKKEQENRNLLEKVKKYKNMMYESVLDAVIAENESKYPAKKMEYTEIFSEDRNQILIVRISHTKECEVEEAERYLEENSPRGTHCILLGSGENMVILMNDTADEPLDGEKVEQILLNYYKITGRKSAVSSMSDNIMDIPKLYEKAVRASRFWKESPVVMYDTIQNKTPESGDIAYPYKSLEEFTRILHEYEFGQAKQVFRELSEMIGLPGTPDFFIKCIHIDLLAIVMNMAVSLEINRDSIDKVYMETLYLCRSTEYEENKVKINENILHLLELLEQELMGKLIDIEQLKTFIRNHCLSCEFTNQAVADKFGVNSAYIGYYFKNRTGVNLSNYVWEIRFEKAKELLANTDLLIDDISRMVGYDVPASFRRKFRTEAGMSPSRFRAEAERKDGYNKNI